jgi:hypothetical protein
MNESLSSNGNVEYPIKPREHLLQEGITPEEIRDQMHKDYLKVLAAAPPIDRLEEFKMDWQNWHGHVPVVLKNLGGAVIGWACHNSRISH